MSGLPVLLSPSREEKRGNVGVNLNENKGWNI